MDVELTTRASLAVDAFASSIGAPAASSAQTKAAAAISALIFHSRVSSFIPLQATGAAATAQLTLRFCAAVAASAESGAREAARASSAALAADAALTASPLHHVTALARFLGGPRSLAPKTDAALKLERRAALLAERDALIRALDAVSLTRPQLVADDERLRSAASMHATLGSSLSVGGTLSKAHVERGRKDIADVRRAVAVLVCVAAVVILQRVLWGVFWVRISLVPSLASLRFWR